MKRAVLVLILLLGCLAGTAPAQDETTSAVAQHRRILKIQRINRLYEAGKYEEALELLNKCQGEEAQDVNILNMRGVVLGKLGKYDEAQKILQRLLEENPSFHPAVYNLGDLLFAKGDYEASLRFFETAYRNDPNNELVRFRLFLNFLVLGREREAAGVVAGMIPAGGTPAWYFVRAALAQKRGETGQRNRDLALAREIYGEDECRDFKVALKAAKF